MTYDEAEAVRRMIDGHWNLGMNNETSELWLSVLMPESIEETMAVVTQMAQRMHYAPKIADFREVMRLSFPKATVPASLPPQEDMPPWMKCYGEARAADDFRYFVEQIPGLAELSDEAHPFPAEPITDKDVWMQIGEYGYEGCAYDFAAPHGENRLCAMHPHQPTKQPLKATTIKKHTFMLCVDCRERYLDRLQEDEKVDPAAEREMIPR